LTDLWHEFSEYKSKKYIDTKQSNSVQIISALGVNTDEHYCKISTDIMVQHLSSVHIMFCLSTTCTCM